MNARIVLLPVVVVITAVGIWVGRRSGSTGVPAATWRAGVGEAMKQARNYDELPAETAVRLSFACDQPRFVYVFSHSTEDGTLLLFPSPNLRADLGQPLAAGHCVLPGSNDGKELAWHTRHQILATTTFLVIAAQAPIAELDGLLPKLRRWTNTARTDGSMQVMSPPDGAELLAGPRTPLPHPLLQRAAELSVTATVVNGPLQPDPLQEGVWLGSWRVKELPGKR